MPRKRRRKSTNEKEMQREEQGRGRRRGERKGEQIEAKRERPTIMVLGFLQYLFFFLFLIIGKEKEMVGRGWRLG